MVIIYQHFLLGKLGVFSFLGGDEEENAVSYLFRAIFWPECRGQHPWSFPVLGMHRLNDVDSGLGPELLSGSGWRSLAGLVLVAGGEMDGPWGQPRSDWHRSWSLYWSAWGGPQQLAVTKYTFAPVKGQPVRVVLGLSIHRVPQEVTELEFRRGPLGLWHLLHQVCLFVFCFLLKTQLYSHLFVFALPSFPCFLPLCPTSSCLSFSLSSCPSLFFSFSTFFSPLSLFNRERETKSACSVVLF